jgi:hypothetical protein
VEIDAGGRASTGGDGELNWGARETVRGLGSSVWVKGAREALGHLYRHGMGGEAAPGGHGHQWPCGLDGIQDGEGIKEGKRSD